MINIVSLVNSIVQDGIREHSRLDLIIKRFRQNRMGMIGLGMTMIFLFLVIISPIIISKDPHAMETSIRLQPPSLEHPFGTDRYGRDVFSRVMLGARLSLYVASVVVAISSSIGVTAGLIAGFYGGKVDEIIMRIADVMFAFPGILLALVVVSILGPGLNKAVLALSIAWIPTMTRITRGSAMSVRQEEYVMAAISYGESDVVVMFREVLPNLISAVLVQGTITFAFAILAEAGLSYLGLSARPPTATWGVMISEGQSVLEIAPWVAVFPGLAIMLTVLGLTFLGVGLRDALDPKTELDVSKLGGK